MQSVVYEAYARLDGTDEQAEYTEYTIDDVRCTHIYGGITHKWTGQVIILLAVIPLSPEVSYSNNSATIDRKAPNWLSSATGCLEIVLTTSDTRIKKKLIIGRIRKNGL